MKKIKFKKRWLFLVLLLLIGSPMALDSSGFCFEEKRWLGKREVVDVMLFGKKAPLMSFDEKVQVMKDRDGSEYPKNCRITGIGSSLYSLRYEVDCVGPHYSEKNLYYYNMIFTNACGKNLDSFGDTVKEKLYKIVLKRNEKYWEGK